MKRDPDRKFWNPEIETMSRDNIKELQLAKLKKQLRYNYENSPFYKGQFERAGMKPEDVRTLEDLRHIPTMGKDDQRRCQEDSMERFGRPYGMLACAPMDKIVRLSSTSGTTGMPTLYTLTRHDVDVNRELTARQLWRIGMRPGHIVIHAVGMSMFASGIPVVDALQAYGTCVVPVGLEAGISRILRYWELCKPDHMMTTPSFGEYLVEKCPEVIGKPASELGMKGMVIGGEPGAEIPEVRKRIMEGLRLEWLANITGGTHAFHGISCHSDSIEPPKGMHFVSEDYCIMELLDPATHEPLNLADGVTGEQCWTFIDWEGTPMMRYRVGDMVQVFTTPCDCGDTTSIRFKIIGRADDMLIIKGVNLYPAAFKNFVAGFIPRVTGEFRIILDSPGHQVKPPLKVKIEYGESVTREDLAGLEKEMLGKAHDQLRVKPSIEFVPPDSLGRSTYKSKYIIRTYESGS